MYKPGLRSIRHSHRTGQVICHFISQQRILLISGQKHIVLARSHTQKILRLVKPQIIALLWRPPRIVTVPLYFIHFAFRTDCAFGIQKRKGSLQPVFPVRVQIPQGIFLRQIQHQRRCTAGS